MRDRCDRWRLWVASDAVTTDPERDAHLAACAGCREQWSAHLALTGLGELPAPPLSRDLGPVLGRVVADRASAGLLTPAQRLAMRIYWLAATFVAGLVLAQLGPTSAPWVPLALFLGAVALAALAAMPALVLLRRRLSWDLMDLVVWTLR